MGAITSGRKLAKARNRYSRLSETITGAAGTTVNVPLDCAVTQLVAAGATANVFAIPDGEVPGQKKALVLITKGGAGNAVVTPANVYGGTIVTLSAVGHGCELLWTGAKWLSLGGTGTLS